MLAGAPKGMGAVGRCRTDRPQCPRIAAPSVLQIDGGARHRLTTRRRGAFSSPRPLPRGSGIDSGCGAHAGTSSCPLRTAVPPGGPDPTCRADRPPRRLPATYRRDGGVARPCIPSCSPGWIRSSDPGDRRVRRPGQASGSSSPRGTSVSVAAYANGDGPGDFGRCRGAIEALPGYPDQVADHTENAKRGTALWRRCRSPIRSHHLVSR